MATRRVLVFASSSATPFLNPNKNTYFLTSRSALARRFSLFPTSGSDIGCGFQKWQNGGGIFHESASIDSTAVVEVGAVVHSESVVGANVHIGSGTIIGPSVSIAHSTQIGFNVGLSNCCIGDSCVIHHGVCIGQDGFGFYVDGDGNMIKKPQVSSNSGWVWNASSAQVYMANSGYHWLCKKKVTWDPQSNWLWLWRMRIPEKYKFLAWLCLKNALPTAAFRFRRGLSTSGVCPRCLIGDEDVLHCIRDCPLSKDIWRRLNMDQRSLDIFSWFVSGSKRFPFLFYSALWWIWRYRNNAIFNASEPWLPEKVVALIKSSSEELHRIFVLQRILSSSPLKLSWSPPTQGTVTVNCDASYMESYDYMGFGCVIRDWKGSWKGGCAGTITRTNILQAELFAIWRGLQLAWDMGYRDVLCETDCHEAFLLLNADNSSVSNDVTDLICRIHGLLKRSWRVDVSLIQRTANAVADALAKYAIRNGVVQVEWLKPNHDFQRLLYQDLHDES